MQRVTPFLWFDNQAEEAANFYVSIFPNSAIVEVSRYGDAGPGPKGSVMVVEFDLDGVRHMALNGGPEYTFNEAVSLFVSCDSQDEVDHYWNALTAGGEEGPCGWLKDKYGLSWQVVPVEFFDLIKDPDAEKANRVTKALYKMSKIDLPTLRAAANAE